MFDSGCFLVEIEGASWSLVLFDRETFSDLQWHARSLARQIGTRAVAYHVNHVRAELEYSLYEDGQPLEHLSDRTGELMLRSSLRDLELREIAADVFQHVERVFREQGIRDPGLSFAALIGAQDSNVSEDRKGATVTVASPEGITRIDYLRLTKAANPVTNAAQQIANNIQGWRNQISQPTPFLDANIQREAREGTHKRRGMRTIEIDNLSLIIKADLDEAAAAVMEVRGADRHCADLLANPQEVLSDAGSYVFRLKDEPWTVMVDGNVHSDYEPLARKLSEQLDTEVLCLGLRGTVGVVFFRWFANGNQLERFHSLTGCPKELDLLKAFDTDCLKPLDPTDTCASMQSDPIDAGNGRYRTGTLQSRARRLKDSFPDTVETFIDAGFRMADTFEPGIRFSDATALVTGGTPDEKFPWNKTDFVQIDYIGPQ